MSDAIATALQGIAVALTSIAATLAGIWAWQRRGQGGSGQSKARGKIDTPSPHRSAGDSVISVAEANRIAELKVAEANRANEFAALRTLVEDHHKDDETAFAEIKQQIKELRDAKHQQATDITAHGFRLRSLDDLVHELRIDAGLVTPPPTTRPRRPGSRG